MARKVGALHAHRLPDPDKVAKHDVFRCDCNKEFYMDTTQGGMIEAKWYPLGESPHFVEYEQTEADAPKIGRWEAPKPEAQGIQGGEEDESVGTEGVADTTQQEATD
jgi:hypothetical protein